MSTLSAALLASVLIACQDAVRAQITLHDPAGKELVFEDGKLEQLAGDLKFCEGPVWLAAEQRLVFSDIPKGRLLQWTAAKGVADFAPSEQGNGNTLDLQGRLISCQHGAQNVVRRETDGKITVLAARHEGKSLNSPNDVAVRSDGTVWFTDPTYGLGKREKGQPGNHVYRLDPTTGVVTVVQAEFDQPNGICFSPDQQRVYVADSGTKQRIGAFPILKGGQKDCTLGEALFWIEGGADGLRCDAKGNLYAAARDGIRILSPAGVLLATIACPKQPTNCAFGGVDGMTLFITARTDLYRLQVRVPGAPVPPVAAKSEPEGASKR